MKIVIVHHLNDVTHYWRDGTQEETFDDRWKSVSDHA